MQYSISKSLIVCIPIGVTWLHFITTVTGDSNIFPFTVSARNAKLLVATKVLGKLTRYGRLEKQLQYNYDDCNTTYQKYPSDSSALDASIRFFAFV